jgi:O-antigen/teichoic acid export membrane protein
MYIFTPGMEISKRTSLIFLTNAFGAAVNLGLNVILVPAYGIAGAARATLLTHLLVFLAYLSISQKFFAIPFEYAKLIGATIFAAVLCYIGSLMQADFFTNYLAKVLLLLFCALACFVIKLVRLSEIKAHFFSK